LSTHDDDNIRFELEVYWLTNRRRFLTTPLLPDNSSNAEVAKSYPECRNYQNTTSQPDKVNSLLPGFGITFGQTRILCGAIRVRSNLNLEKRVRILY